MDGGDGWYVASCHQRSQRTIIDRVMTMRFRPIAPKPASGGDSPGGFSPAVMSPAKRVKRKYVRARKDDNNPRVARGRRSRSSDKNEKPGDDHASSTLQLMPERSDGYGSTESRSLCATYRTVSEPSVDRENRDPPPDRVSVGPLGSGKVVVETWVTVESVTDMCMEIVRGLGRTDVERIKNLERDTCPGFVSGGCLSRVQWVNEAYRKMVVDGGGGGWPEVSVLLVYTGNNDNYQNNNNNNNNSNGDNNYKVGRTDGAGFTCRVRVEYMRNMKEKCWKIMPCDVWRLDCGGFAWRLDVKAALSLGI